MLHRHATRVTSLALCSLAITACAGIANRPTEEIITSKLAKPKQVVRVVLQGTTAEMASRLETKGQLCTDPTLRTSGAMPSGSGGVVTVSQTIHQRLERGAMADGSPWVALRMDSSLHLVAFGVLFEQKDADHVEAKVFPADAKKVAAITAGLESGSLFCEWRDLNYAYD